MLLESLICFILASIIFAWIIAFRRDFFSPVIVYSISYSLTLGVAFLAFHEAMTPFKIKTWFFLLGGGLSFILGYASVRMVWYSLYPQMRLTQCVISANYDWYRHFMASMIVFFFYLVGVLVFCHAIGGLTVFQKDVHLIMNRDFNLGLWSYVYASYPLIILLFGVSAFRAINPVKWIRVLSRCVIVSALLLGILTFPSRGMLLLSAGGLTVMYHFLSRRIAAWVVLVGLLIAVAVFIGVAFMRNQFGTDIRGLVLEKVMMLPYVYIANNYWNLDYAINPPPDLEIHPFTYGLDFFNGFTEFLPIGYQLQQAYHWDNLFNDRIQKVSGLNTIVYLWEVYKDLGLFGVIFFPASIGALMGFLYHKMQIIWHPRLVIFYSMLIFQIAWSFMVETYKNGLVWLWVFAIFAVTSHATQKNHPSLPRQQHIESHGAD